MAESIQTRDSWAQMSSPGRQHFTHVTIHRWKMTHILCDFVGRGLSEAWTLFSPDFAPCAFFLLLILLCVLLTK